MPKSTHDKLKAGEKAVEGTSQAGWPLFKRHLFSSQRAGAVQAGQCELSLQHPESFVPPEGPFWQTRRPRTALLRRLCLAGLCPGTRSRAASTTSSAASACSESSSTPGMMFIFFEEQKVA